MRISTGCDLEEVKKFESRISNEAFLKKVYTAAEQEYCLNKSNPAQHFAARWCAKESVVKALASLGINSIEYLSIEIINNTEGCPIVFIHDPRCIGFEIKVSLSHAGDMAMATAIIVISK